MTRHFSVRFLKADLSSMDQRMGLAKTLTLAKNMLTWYCLESNKIQDFKLK